jgi:hypothetical protein
MMLTDLSKNILTKLKNTGSLTLSDWPTDITLESEVTKNLRSLESYTNKESFLTPSQGAVGWEYGIYIYFIIDKIFISNTIKGDYESVNISKKVNIDTVYLNEKKQISKSGGEFVKFNLDLNGKKFVTNTYKTKDLQSGLINGVIANFHTHPKYYHDKNTSQYTFFSSQDITSLLYGRTPILGLLAGNNIWICCKTSNSQMIPSSLLAEASRLELNEGVNGVNKFIQSSLSDFGIVFYHGTFGSKLRRL